jgi:hypothetical protein
MLSTKVRKQSIGKMRSIRLLAVLLVPMVALILGTTAWPVWASGWAIEECEDGLDESAVFFEFNSTDCDVGIQFFWDGPAWKWMIVKDEHRRAVLDVFPLQQVRAVGLTEGRFEGDEPKVIENGECDLTNSGILGAIEDFIRQYKDGEYTFKGKAVEERCLLLGEAELTYNILQPVVFTDTSLPNISWTAPSGVLLPPGSSEVVGYEIVIELVVEASDEQVFKETTTLPGDATSYEVSDTFMNLINSPPGDIVELKIEILADEPSGNRTITEEVLIEAVD